MSVNEGRVIDIHAVINILFDQATSKDTDEPVISLTGITAAYTQSGAVYPDTPLNDLKNDLVVTAIYSDESTETLQASDYTLTGTLTVGTSVITAAYQGKTDTFNVTVSQHSGGTSDMNGWTDGVAYTNLTIIENEYVDKTDGSFDSYNGWSRTGFVPCNGCSTLLFNQNSRESSYNAFYDSGKNFISAFSLAYSANISVVVPSNAYYYVLSNVTANLNGCINNGIIPNA